MKSLIASVLVFLFCLYMSSCGGTDTVSTGNADHDYVIALMEKGDYAMAIQVLEHLQEQSGEPGLPEATESPAEQLEVTPEPAPALSELQQLAVDTVAAFMAEKGEAMIQGFERETAGKAREPRVVNVMEYHLADYDGQGGVAHCLMIALEADIFVGDGFDDSLRLLVDLDSGAVYNSVELDEDILNRGEPANREELNTFLLNGYFSHLIFGEGVWASIELREEFSEADLAAINEALEY